MLGCRFKKPPFPLASLQVEVAKAGDKIVATGTLIVVPDVGALGSGKGAGGGSNGGGGGWWWVRVSFDC